jgi:RHS repeat-associated protein
MAKNKKRKKQRRKNQGSICRLVCVAIFIICASSAYLSVGANCAGGGASASISPQPQPGVVYFLDDHQGNTHLVTDSVGNIVHEESRYPYGAKRYDQNNADNSEAVNESKPYYSYTGKEYDEDTGLVYFGGRYYAPELGRWITPDPLFLEKDPAMLAQMSKELNLYAYVQGNPMSMYDYYGSKGVYITFGAGIGVGDGDSPESISNSVGTGIYIDYNERVGKIDLGIFKQDAEQKIIGGKLGLGVSFGVHSVDAAEYFSGESRIRTTLAGPVGFTRAHDSSGEPIAYEVSFGKGFGLGMEAGKSESSFLSTRRGIGLIKYDEQHYTTHWTQEMDVGWSPFTLNNYEKDGSHDEND